MGARRQTPTPGVVMAPVSPAVARLLHKLQAQIIREADARPVSPGAVILPPPDKLTELSHSERCNGYRQLSCHSASGGYSISLQTPLTADPQHSWHRPGRWYGSEVRIDEAGRRWSAQLACDYVMDDFGELVPAGGAQ